MRVLLPWSFPLVLLASVCGCADDAGGLFLVDAGSDAGRGPAAIPRVDSGAARPTAVPFCDRFDATSCETGKVCDEVIEVIPSTGDVQVYAGCVDVSGLRGQGDPCTPWNDRYLPVPEEVYFDPCGDGLVCGDDPKVRGATSCQPVCQSGAFGDAFVGCDSDSAFCLSVGAYREVCRESDQCDPQAQTGCRAGEGCYLRLNDLGDAYLSLCLPVPAAAEVVADHKACSYVNDCRPGSSCSGPVHLSPDEWTSSDYTCRRLCRGVAADLDAGTDDAGLGDDCSGGAACIPFSEGALSFKQLPSAPFGQCER